MADTLIFVVTCADENADKAIIPFALGNSALAMDAEAIIILQSTGVFLGKKDYARHVNAPGFPPLQQLMEIFKEEGGSSWKSSRKKGAKFMPANHAYGQEI